MHCFWWIKMLIKPLNTGMFILQWHCNSKILRGIGWPPWSISNDLCQLHWKRLKPIPMADVKLSVMSIFNAFCYWNALCLSQMPQVVNHCRWSTTMQYADLYWKKRRFGLQNGVRLLRSLRNENDTLQGTSSTSSQSSGNLFPFYYKDASRFFPHKNSMWPINDYKTNLIQAQCNLCSHY